MRKQVKNPCEAVREAFVNQIIHADYLSDAGTLKVVKRSNEFEFTNLGILKLPVEDIYRGGNSKSRNPRMQTMLRMISKLQEVQGNSNSEVIESAEKS